MCLAGSRHRVNAWLTVNKKRDTTVCINNEFESGSNGSKEWTYGSREWPWPPLGSQVVK